MMSCPPAAGVKVAVTAGVMRPSRTSRPSKRAGALYFFITPLLQGGDVGRDVGGDRRQDGPGVIQLIKPARCDAAGRPHPCQYVQGPRSGQEKARERAPSMDQGSFAR